MSLQYSSDDKIQVIRTQPDQSLGCLLYTSDAADE